MSYQVNIELLRVTDTHATFSVSRAPNVPTSKMAMAGLMATVLKLERGGEYTEWMAKLAPLATTKGSEWADRRMKTVIVDRPDYGEEEVTVRFWTDEDSMFKRQPDGSYAASMRDLAGGARRGPVPLEVKQQGSKPRKG